MKNRSIQKWRMNEYRRKYFEKMGIYTQKQQKLALDCAHEIRKFEIELYWKRTTYMSVILGAIFIAMYTISDDSGKIAMCTIDSGKSDDNGKLLLFLLPLLGMIVSLGWIFVNKGSRFWQENWENHIDMLEDEFTGKLYKTVSEGNFLKNAFSTSKINELISAIIFFAFTTVTYYQLPNYPISNNLASDTLCFFVGLFSRVIFYISLIAFFFYIVLVPIILNFYNLFTDKNIQNFRKWAMFLLSFGVMIYLIVRSNSKMNTKIDIIAIVFLLLLYSIIIFGNLLPIRTRRQKTLKLDYDFQTRTNIFKQNTHLIIIIVNTLKKQLTFYKERFAYFILLLYICLALFGISKYYF